MPAAAIALAAGVLPATAGQAAPKPSIGEVQHRIDALTLQEDQAAEAYDFAKVQLDASSRKAAASQARVAAATDQLGRLQQQMSEFAAAAYRRGGSDQMLMLVTSGSPQTFLEQASSLDQLARTQRDGVDQVRVAHHELAQAQAQAAEQLRAERAIEGRVAAQKAKIDSTLGQQQALLAGLQADQRRILAEAAARQAATERAQAAAAQAAVAKAPNPVSQAVHAVGKTVGKVAGYTGPASGRASAAVRYATAQLGKPYQWGAAGPSSFDCSGLTMMAWRQAGVSLPHSSQAQFGSGQRVSVNNLQPGDLVFYGSPIHHVALYIGNGQVVVAPHTGDVVKVQTAVRGDTVGAVRP